MTVIPDPLPGLPPHTAELLTLASLAEINEELHWMVRGALEAPALRVGMICNDAFWWATADVEAIEPEDMPLLWATYEELAALESAARNEWEAGGRASPMPYDMAALADLPLLYCARKRKMRPQRPMLKSISGSVLDLFLAAGPERDARSEG